MKEEKCCVHPEEDEALLRCPANEKMMLVGRKVEVMSMACRKRPWDWCKMYIVSMLFRYKCSLDIRMLFIDWELYYIG